MASAGKRIELNMTGTPTAMTDEPTTEVSGTVFQITNTAKRVLDPTGSFTVEVNAVAADEDTYTLNRLSGTITFDSSQTGATVTISGDYLPLAAAGEANSVALNMSANNADVTTFASSQSSGGYVSRQQQLKDYSIEIGGFWVDERFTEDLQSGTPIVVEFYLDYDDASPDWRAWVIPSADNISGSVDSPVEESVSFECGLDAEGNAVTFS